MEGMLGEIRMFGGNFAPRSWALCQGQLLPINSNQALFSILGTIYGGDGRTTFALPDLRGRVAVQAGRGPGLSDYRQGAKGGLEYVTLTQAQIPSHTHFAQIGGKPHLNLGAGAGDTDVAGGNALAASATGDKIYTDNGVPNPNIRLHEGSVDLSATTVTNSNTGGSREHTNLQPYLAVNFIIALYGVFPSRS